MNRRQFLRQAIGSALWLGAAGCVTARQASPDRTAQASLLKGMRIIDAHAHPLRIAISSDPTTPTVEMMKEAGLAASAFNAVGDRAVRRTSAVGTPFFNTLRQLEAYKDSAGRGEVKLVLKAADVPETGGPGIPPGAILAIEGGDALEGRLSNLDAFHGFGVRMLGLIHFVSNELGDSERDSPKNGGLTPFGRQVVERMNALGMIVDVSHCDPKTLRDVLRVSAAPVVDSHGNPQPVGVEKRNRLRNWSDLTMIAKAGGVACTWPSRRSSRSIRRVTMADWADEILLMKKRLGMAHVGLGTDGGGTLPRLITGYADIRDLPKLAAAMARAGLSRQDTAAYMGGNFYRVLKRCLG
jgi:membrane dipeptidase